MAGTRSPVPILYLDESIGFLVPGSFVPMVRPFVPAFRSLVPSFRSFVPYSQIHHTVMPKNTKVPELCGCRDNFSWKLIPAEHSDFYISPHHVNTVDHSAVTYKPLGTFTQALWEGYNICLPQILNNDHLTDYFSAVYQQHKSSCFRNVTQYSVKSVKNILLIIE